MLNRILAFLIATLMAAGMVACGGSSGGIAAPLAPAAHLPITPDNAPDITADVINAVSSVFDIVSVAEVANLPFPDLPSANASLAVLSNGSFDKFAAMTQSLIVDTGSCDSGTYTTTWDDLDDNQQVSTGDTFDISFAGCFFSDMGVTLGGDASITSLNIQGDPTGSPPWSVGANFACSDLTGDDGGGATTINGDLDFSISSVDGIDVFIAISGTEMIAVEDSSTDILSLFTVTESVDTNTLMLVINAAGTLTREEFNGSVRFETPVGLVIFADQEYPSTGQMLITHATSSVLATVLDNVNVELAIDADGDGTAETTMVVSWLELGIE